MGNVGGSVDAETVVAVVMIWMYRTLLLVGQLREVEEELPVE